MPRVSQTFEQWEKIFSVKNFDLSKDLHFVTADEIKEITGVEPRIMAKMDSTKDLPPIFKQNGYFLLPVKNGEYAVVRGEGFHQLEQKAAHTNHTSRIKFHLTTAGRGSSEMQYLDYSFNSGALENVLGISPLYPSIRGRNFTKPFIFKVKNSELKTGSVQIEVDSGLEGEDAIVLIEAKVKTPEDFIIRQLFYPYNHFRIVSPNKKIIPMFFTYEPQTKLYNFWIYEFTNQADYNSIRLKEVRSLSITSAHELEISDLSPQINVVYKDLVPQANDLNKVIELIFKINEGIDEYKIVAEYFEFDRRQSSYYREAAEALGLVTTRGGKYLLTEAGKHLVTLQTEKRNLFMVKLMGEFELIKESLRVLQSNGQLKRSDIEALITKNSTLAETTVSRRAYSLIAWLKWIAEVTGTFMYVEPIFVLESNN